MLDNAKFIWLDSKVYPDLQKSPVTVFDRNYSNFNFCVAGFKKAYKFDKIIKTAKIRVFGDSRFFLHVNSEFVGMGPVPSGGLAIMPEQYASDFDVIVNEKYFNAYAKVQLKPIVQTDTSNERGGFILAAELHFEDGEVKTVFTDSTWLSRRENEYISPRVVDYTVKRDEWVGAVETPSVWNVKLSQIKNLVEQCVSSETYVAKGNEKTKFSKSLEKIYSAYVRLTIEATSEYEIKFISSELNGISERVHIIKGNKNSEYRSHEMDSIGEYKIDIQSKDGSPVSVKTDILFVHYPSEEVGGFKCSDEMLNRINELCRWTVKICRQSIELDSPVHQENLMCWGDYNIESLVNNYSTGDYSLTRFDLLRMGNYLHTTNGWQYNRSYSLIWIYAIYEYFMYSGDATIFCDAEKGIESVMQKFETYKNNDGILENLPIYTFVDWSYIDGYGLQYPPRALGETVMNAFYYNAIIVSSKIYNILGNTEKAEKYINMGNKFKELFNRYFYDASKQMYFDGRNIPNEISDVLPENSDKRYYTIYSNTLAVLFDLCDSENSARIMKSILDNEEMMIAQPYFMHYVIDAVYKTGLFEEYGLKLIRKWEKLVNECEKGLKEVWNDYEGYEIDYSHGWGGTPAYQLPCRISGIEILEPGFKKIRIKPNLYGLDYADIKIPTPYGVINCHITKDKTDIDIPEGITVAD